jgi:hypothetical protein
MIDPMSARLSPADCAEFCSANTSIRSLSGEKRHGAPLTGDPEQEFRGGWSDRASTGCQGIMQL